MGIREFIFMLFLFFCFSIEAQKNRDSLHFSTTKKMLRNSVLLENKNLDSLKYIKNIVKCLSDSNIGIKDTFLNSHRFSSCYKFNENVINLRFSNRSTGFKLFLIDSNNKLFNWYVSEIFERGHFFYASDIRLLTLDDKIILIGLEGNWNYYFIFDSKLELLENSKKCTEYGKHNEQK